MQQARAGSRALVTGATGYLGGLLAPRLLEHGYAVRVLARDRSRLSGRDWAHQVEVVEGDAGDPAALDWACAGVDVAYYLVHSMDGAADFVTKDRAVATAFGAAAKRAGVGRIVYLSGLHPPGRLSPHLASRVEVGEILLASGVPTAVVQAAVILGSGSASFEMLRHLTTRLPVMLTPKWLDNRIQPIAVADVLDHLVVAATLPPQVNRTFDIGGPQVLTYRQMIEEFAKIAGLRPRRILALPVLTPGLASHWVGVVTPVPAAVARPLVGSLVHEVVCTEHDLTTYLGKTPEQLVGYQDAVAAALADGPAPGS